MSGVDDKVVTVNKLLEGNYVFKLIVTDDKGLTGSDTVAVNVKKGTLRSKSSEHNRLHVAATRRADKSLVVYRREDMLRDTLQRQFALTL